MFDQKGSVFALSNIFSANAAILGRDKFNGVIMTTQSGNMYLLTEDEIFIDRNRSLEIGAIKAHRVDRDWLDRARLVIGQSFRFLTENGMGNTSQLIEAVPFLMRIHTDEFFADIPSCDIVKRFEQGLPDGHSLHSLMLIRF